MARKDRTLAKEGVKLSTISPLTHKQKEAFNSCKHLVLYGLAGTGKTFISLYLAYEDIARGLYQKVVIIRSAVPTRDQGFMPGTEKEKASVYETPYIDITNELFNCGTAYDSLQKHRTVCFQTTSFIRGLTLRNATIIVDECQSMSFHELDSIITRLGDNCRIIFCGDFNQSDLVKEASGMGRLLDILKTMEEFDMIKFGVDDIVRSDFVRNYIIAKHKES